MNWSQKSFSHKVLSIFAPLLILTGLLGFLAPPALSLMSGATTYNIFHLVFGAVGLAILFSRNEDLISGFNISFGAVDLYQAIASSLRLFPENLFHWTRVDDVLHITFGVLLIAAGFFGKRRNFSYHRR